MTQQTKPNPIKGFTLHEFQRRIINDPEWYIREVLGNEHVWEKQVDIVKSVLQHKRTAVRGCVASSKTVAGAMAVHAFMDAFGPVAEVYTIAPTFRQTKKFLWKHIRMMHKKAIVPRGGKLLDTEWKIADDWSAAGLSPKDPDALHGAHAENILIIIDEAQGVEQDMIDAAENAMAGGNAHLLILFNPNSSPGEEAYESFHKKLHLYNRITIAATDTPNVRAGRTIIPGMIEGHQVREWNQTYGWNSNFVRVKVRALFPKQDPDALIPIEWIEKAINREARLYEELSDIDIKKGIEPWIKKVMGVDVANKGPDSSTLVKMFGRQVQPIIVLNGKDEVQVAGRIAKEVKDDGITKTCIEQDGLGVGVVDICRHEQVPGTQGIVIGSKARKPSRFPNKRSEMLWNVRESLNPHNDDPIGLPEGDLLLEGELSAIRFDQDGQGRNVVESTPALKARIKRSPDRLMGLNQAIAAGSASATIPRGGVNPKRVAQGAGTPRDRRQRLMTGGGGRQRRKRLMDRF